MDNVTMDRFFELAKIRNIGLGLTVTDTPEVYIDTFYEGKQHYVIDPFGFDSVADALCFARHYARKFKLDLTLHGIDPTAAASDNLDQTCPIDLLLHLARHFDFAVKLVIHADKLEFRSDTGSTFEPLGFTLDQKTIELFDTVVDWQSEFDR